MGAIFGLIVLHTHKKKYVWTEGKVTSAQYTLYVNAAS